MGDRAGHPEAGSCALRRGAAAGLPTRPLTLFVNKATIAGDRHATLTWGAAQAGVAAGVADAVFTGTVPRDEVDELVLIAAVWVNPLAEYADAVYANNREATDRALPPAPSPAAPTVRPPPRCSTRCSPPGTRPPTRSTGPAPRTTPRVAARDEPHRQPGGHL